MQASVVEIIGAYDDGRPLAEASTIPAAWYLDPRILQLERQTVFSRTWQVVARTDQVTEPGQYVTAEIASEPVVVVCGNDRKLRAFFNVCRHHAAAVVSDCGRTQLFRCPYHGWSYSLEGELKGAPEFEGVAGFDRSGHGLVPVRVDSWEQFVFATLDPETPPLREFLGGLVVRAVPLRLGELKFFERRTYELKCNWKVFVDNYLDGGYHVPHLHKGLNSVLDYVHYTVENEDRYCLQSSPMVGSSQDAQTAATRTGDHAYYFWLYPNFMINWHAGVMDTNLVIPAGVDRTLVIFDFYFTAADAAANRASVDVSERIQNEDVAICESVQRGLGSRAYGAGRLSVRREAGEHLFHRLLAADLKRGL